MPVRLKIRKLRKPFPSEARVFREAAGIPAAGKQQNLNQFTIDLTANAKAGKIDTVLGRDHEIRQIIDILTRRRQNNPILTGEAGVGKTAVVEGFALRVAAGDVPPVLKNVSIRSLDLALLQAGAGVKGEFENRLKGLIEEVKSSPSPIILFIDEAHTMIGAGGPAGQGDAANLLKPALARGELRTIAATTWSEYKKFFEKDAALARRFQVVKVEEPTEEQCRVMLRGIVASLEKHHNVRILDEAVHAATKFSHRYLAGRQLPDKAVSVMDTACARLSLGQNATPPLIEDAMRMVDDLDVQQRVLERETAVGVDHSERLANIAKQRTEVAARLKTLEERRGKELSLVTRIRDIRTQLEAAVAPPAAATSTTAASAGTAAQPAMDAACAPGGTRKTECRTRCVARRFATDASLRGHANRRRSYLGMDRHPCRKNAARRNQYRSPSQRSHGRSRHRTEPRSRSHRPAHFHEPRRYGRSRQARRRFYACGP